MSLGKPYANVLTNLRLQRRFPGLYSFSSLGNPFKPAPGSANELCGGPWPRNARPPAVPLRLLMARLLALDYGTKRVGVATTDLSQLIASPLTTVRTHELFAWLTHYLATEPVAALIVGRPRHLDGGPTDTTPHVVGLIRNLKKLFPALPVHEVDERFTSTIAHQTMLAGGLGRKARQDKALVDKISAAIILQSFMESRAFLGG